MVPKHVAFAPGNKWGLGINGAWPHLLYEHVLFLTKWGQAPFIPWASLSSPPERNLASSAFLTVFHHTAFRQAGNPTQSGVEGVRRGGQALSRRMP